MPGIDTYFSRYAIAWKTPHPTDPYDLALTRGKIVIGGAGVGTLAIIGGVKAGVVGGTGWVLRGAWYYGSHYGRSMMYWGARNPNATIELGGGLGGAVGLGTSPDVAGPVTRGIGRLENGAKEMIEGGAGNVFAGHGTLRLSMADEMVELPVDLTIPRHDTKIQDITGHLMENNAWKELAELAKTDSDIADDLVGMSTHLRGSLWHNYTLTGPKDLSIMSNSTTVEDTTSLSSLLKDKFGRWVWAACTEIDEKR